MGPMVPSMVSKLGQKRVVEVLKSGTTVEVTLGPKVKAKVKIGIR